jgi:DNA mismatch endonuclease (patch repair protein)
MADVVSKEIRSRMMSGIRGKNTKIEIVLRRGLHALGFRYRIHANLPGRPDLVFPKAKAVIFVHGCFWHAHSCHLFKWPKSREEFWRTKISGNAERDRRNEQKLLEGGWRIGVVWECALKGRARLDERRIVQALARWIQSSRKRLTIEGL